MKKVIKPPVETDDHILLHSQRVAELERKHAEDLVKFDDKLTAWKAKQEAKRKAEAALKARLKAKVRAAAIMAQRTALDAARADALAKNAANEAAVRQEHAQWLSGIRERQSTIPTAGKIPS